MRFPKLDLLAGKIETRGHNADDLRTPPLYPQAFPYDIRFSSETAEPQSMAQYNHAFLAFCFIGGEASSHHRLNARNRSEEPRLNSSHSQISYARFCLKKKKSTASRATRVRRSMPIRT